MFPELIYSAQLKKIALVQTLKNTITPHTYKLKSLSTLPITNVIFVDLCKYFFYTSL